MPGRLRCSYSRCLPAFENGCPQMCSQQHQQLMTQSRKARKALRTHVQTILLEARLLSEAGMTIRAGLEAAQQVPKSTGIQVVVATAHQARTMKEHLIQMILRLSLRRHGCNRVACNFLASLSGAVQLSYAR